MKWKLEKIKGFSLVEVLLSVALFALVVTAIVGMLTYGQESSALSGAMTRATFLANEGIEVARNMRDESFSNLSDGTYGLTVSNGKWIFSGSFDVNGIFTRQIKISTDSAGVKNVTANVTWMQNLQRSGSISLSTYLANWRDPVAKGGILVYGDGGTTSDQIKYKVFDSNGVWGSAGSTADVDPNTSNRYLRSVKIYSSSARNEKVMISRHYDGTNQYIYAQVYDGSSWGNVSMLSNWNSSAFLDVQNFSGTYLNNGNFMAVYSDNTAIPKMRIWNGTNWSNASSLTNLGTSQIPVYIVVKNRLGTNEVMAAFFTQGSDAITQYYSGSSWSAITTHATAAPLNTKRFIDFAWSSTSATTGMLAFVSGSNAKNISAKIWTANGNGSGTWGASASSSNQASNPGALNIAERLGTSEYQICNKDAGTSPTIRCYKASSSGAAITFSNPTNQTISSTDTGIQKSYDSTFVASSNSAMTLFSDSTSVPKIKTYSPATSTWSASSISISTTGYSPGVFRTMEVVPYPQGIDDVMLLMADASQNLYTAVWDGSSNSIYSSPVGKSFGKHGIMGSNGTDFWYDFSWDQY